MSFKSMLPLASTWGRLESNVLHIKSGNLEKALEPSRFCQFEHNSMERKKTDKREIPDENRSRRREKKFDDICTLMLQYVEINNLLPT